MSDILGLHNVYEILFRDKINIGKIELLNEILKARVDA